MKPLSCSSRMKSLAFVAVVAFAAGNSVLGADNSINHAGHGAHGMPSGEMKREQGEQPEHAHPFGPSDCSEMEVWDYSSGMCMPLPMKDMTMRMLMVHGNAFGVWISEQGPRGRDAFASPNMLMGDLGTSVGSDHYLNLNLMLTAEKWTFPEEGYPELLQIGEHNEAGVPYIDAQHPHSSPIMGLTLSDTIRLGPDKDHLKVFFAPRGQSTEGPIAFMHRPTGMVNPDAPLGHHIGQDVGHITSTVLGASLKWNVMRFEASAFHGAEPEPAHVDLPLGVPDSGALRVIGEISDDWAVMASAARVTDPEPDDPSIKFVNRYSASSYNTFHIGTEANFRNALIFGLVNHYDHADSLSSFAEEFALQAGPCTGWGRFEVLQRTASELAIPVSGDSRAGHWVGAATLGYTHRLARLERVDLSLGGSVTKDFLPSEFIGAYGGNPWTGKVFLQIGGMGMWHL